MFWHVFDRHAPENAKFRGRNSAGSGASASDQRAVHRVTRNCSEADCEVHRDKAERCLKACALDVARSERWELGSGGVAHGGILDEFADRVCRLYLWGIDRVHR